MSTGRRSAGVPRAGLAVLATLAYLPALLTRPGRMPADTKLYLYLDPGRLVADAPFTWDTRQFGGWVPHQTIAYLWPQGPWYWAADHLGLPDWVAHRLWIGTLMFLAGWGVLWVARMFGLSRGGAVAAAAVYQCSPYLLPYVSRTSAMLLPWAALGWIIGLTVKAARADAHRWRAPALLALVLMSCSAVNATAVLMVAPAPVLWLIHATVDRTITWRRAVDTAARIGVLATAVSLWWIVMLRTQGQYGADVLSYSESLQATSLTSVSTEVVRGAGYWLFYVRDPYAFTTSASQVYMESGLAIAVSYAVVLVCMAGLALTRWGQRRYAAFLVLAGVVLAVGVHPIADASPLMSPLAENSRSGLALAIRSSTRAVPMAVLGLALGAGALVTALARTRVRWRALAPALVVLLAVVNLPALFDGGLVDPALTRDQNPPAAWRDAADALSAGDTEARVLQLPGAEFGAFRWGYTVDPPLPGMTTKPLLTRDLLPLGSPGLMDLLYALDDRVQQGTLEPEALVAVARMLGVDTIWLTNDQAYDRFRTPLPTALAAWIQQVPGLGTPTDFGSPQVNVPDIPLVDEAELATPATALPAVQLYPVEDPQQIVRASTVTVILVGSGDGIVDAAAAGLLDGTEAVVYAADLPALGDQPEATPALVVLTDTNRDRAHHWRSSQDVTGYTETGGPEPDALQIDEGDQRLPVFGPVADASAQTTAHLEGGLVVRASGYGEPFAYRPEDRPAMAVDGDPATAWVVADRADPVGQRISVSATDGTLTLLQPQDPVANRMITEVTIHPAAGSAFPVALGPASLTTPGQLVDLPGNGEVTIEITAVAARPGGTDTGPSAVGFAELGVGSHQEVVTMPAYPDGPLAAGVPLAVVLTRERVDPMDRWRSDPEAAIVRAVDLPRDGSFTTTVTLRLDARADDATLNSLTATSGPVADRRLTGDPAARGAYATDDSADTAWTTPFGHQVGATLTLPTNGQPIGELTITQPTDDQHSTITSIRLTAGGTEVDVEVPAPDAAGASTVRLPTLLSTPRSATALTLTVTAVDERTTIDRRFGEPTVLPVAIRDVRADALVRTVIGTPTGGCRSDLLTIDGQPVGLMIGDQQAAALADGEAVHVTTCDGALIDLASGPHRLTSVATGTVGLQVDQVTLRDGEPRTSLEAPTVTVQRDHTSRTAMVGPCPEGCWLILGEGYNPEWSASVDGTDLGRPVQLSGGMNGWWLPPSAEARLVTMEWGAQTPVTVAVLLSGVAALGCSVLALRRRAATAPLSPPFPPPAFPDLRTERATRRNSVIVALVAMALTALVASPATAGPAALVGVAVVLTRRPRLAAVAGTAGMAMIAATIVLSQIRHRYAANAGWPLEWEHLHRLGLLVVVLLAASTLSEWVRPRPPSDDAATAPPR